MEPGVTKTSGAFVESGEDDDDDEDEDDDDDDDDDDDENDGDDDDAADNDDEDADKAEDADDELDDDAAAPLPTVQPPKKKKKVLTTPISSKHTRIAAELAQIAEASGGKLSAVKGPRNSDMGTSFATAKVKVIFAETKIKTLCGVLGG